MRKQHPIQKLNLVLDTAALQAFLANCTYWNEHKQRTDTSTSPHREVDDVYVRFVPVEQWGKSQEMHWYHDDLTALCLPIVSFVYNHIRLDDDSWSFRTNGEKNLGGILITRIPAGKQVYPHTDSGWHAETYSKYCVCVKANPEQAFCFHKAELRCETGRLFWFDNSLEHWVTNPSAEDRISMIVCVKTPQGIHRP